MRKKTRAALLTAALILGSAGAAFATTQYPAEGGTWEYGNGVTSAWSYYTVDLCHGSSIKNADGILVARSVDTAAGKRSNAYINHAPFASGFHFYYRVC